MPNKPTKPAPRTRRPISAARLYKAITEFIDQTDLTGEEEPTIAGLIEALKEAIVTEATQ